MYLSSYEGFGLPPVEAAKCGTPTLMYNNSSLKEIMPETYAFAEENNELLTLQKLISEKEKGTIFSSTVADWKTYADRFIEIAQS
jgi:glycosyltransferase involved in cell wall biosynthesis